MSRHHRRHRRWKFFSLFVWHRYTGLSIASLVLLLAVSGIALNHTNRLQLDQQFVQSPWLLDYYGIKQPEKLVYRVQDHWISQIGSQIFLDATRIPGEFAALRGAVYAQPMLVIATLNKIILLTEEGQLVEQLGSETLPGEIEQIGLNTHAYIIIQTANGNYRTDANFLEWSKYNQDDAQWCVQKNLPEALHTTLDQQYRGASLSWERVILDLHSGRILGTFGIVLMDIAALGLIFLAASGCIVWMQRGKRRKSQHQQQ